MDIAALVSRFSPLLKKHWLPLALGTLGMIFFAYGLIGLLGSNKNTSREANFDSNPAPESVNLPPKKVNLLVVDVEGAVVTPGLYKLPQDSRIQDGLVAAGGLSASADREYIAKNLNLAIKLTDGAKIYIPSVGEIVGSSSVSDSFSQFGAAGTININSASTDQLDGLPGIGPVTVQKIIAGRPYGSVQELLDKKIVGAKVFDQIKDKLSVY